MPLWSCNQLKTIAFKAGDIILNEGDVSHTVYQIESGDVEVFSDTEGQSVVLGSLVSGDYLGEMGSIEHKPRCASARAKTDVNASEMTREEFLDVISKDPFSAYRLISRLSERLRLASQRLVEAAQPDLHSTEQPVPTEPVEEVAPVRDTVAKLYPASPKLERQLPKEGVEVSTSYAVGRIPSSREPEVLRTINLKLKDSVPYRLSREHFEIFQSERGYAVQDLGSTLGTEVNGRAVGEIFGSDVELLQPGENTVVAGGFESPYVFKVVVQ
jgi:CRP-like cAMP-binding protein